MERIAQSYFAQVGNKVPFEEAIKEIGAQAWVALRLPIEGLMARDRNVARQAAAQQSAEELAQQSGRIPPGTGAGAREDASQQKELNVFEQLAEEILEEDF